VLLLQFSKHYVKSFFKYGVADDTLHYWQAATPPSHYKQLVIFPVLKRLKFVLSWQLHTSEIAQLVTQALLSDFKKLLFAQVKQFVKLVQVEQFEIFKLHKTHL